MEAVAVDQLAVAEREDLDGGAVALGGDSDHVHGPDVTAVGGLPLGQVADGEEAVAVAGCLFEALSGRGLLHLPLEVTQNGARLA